MIIFKSIRWKNFLSTGNVFTEVNLYTNKTTLIVGDNGAGKSTILDALSFGLYGKAFRKINKPQLVNSINQKGLVVEIDFETNNKQYTVRRGIKPSLFEIIIDGIVVDQSADVGDYQEILEKNILKINHKSFCQICILGSASFVPFMQLTAAHRREIIEDLLDIQVFTIMNTILKERVSSNKELILSTDHEYKSTEEKIEMEKKHIETMQASVNERIEEMRQLLAQKQQEVNQATERRREAVNRKEELIKQIEADRDIKEKITKCEKLRSSTVTKIELLEDESRFFDYHDDCPTCKQGIDTEHKEKMYATNAAIVDSHKANLKKLDTAYKKLKKQQQVVEEVEASIVIQDKEIAVIDSIVSTSNKYIQQLEKEIKKLKKQTSQEQQTSEVLDSLIKQRQELSTLREKLSEDRKIYDVASALLKDSGIKTKIIKQYVPVINKLINKYLSSMDFFVNFELNESFEEKIKSRYRDEFSYASFSEGEKSRLDLALLFTWRAIAKLRNSASTNLLILDEVFDGSLDASGSDELLKILQTLTEGNNVFIISHKTDVFLDKFDKVLRFQKQKNFSRVVEV